MSAIPVIEMLPLGDFATNAFVVTHESEPDRCWVIDCPGMPGELIDRIEARGLRPAGIVLTHCHHDHIAGIDTLLSRFGPMPIACHTIEKAWNESPELNLSIFLGTPATATPPDVLLEEGSPCPLGRDWNMLHVPGHSPGSIAFLHEPSHCLIAGDTLFAGSMGRVDFPTSDPEAMRHSLSRLMTLSDETRVFPGHGGPTTIGEERLNNPFLRDGIPVF